ncbi:MAG TPA: PIG-L family deacetylase [Candidatus Eisenbacteria bacterium]|nr:PIG-L family deacetylase [Candidatus Eisenbacteria bacterium]
MLSALESHLPGQPGHALLLGDVAKIEPLLRARGWTVTRGTAERDFGVAPKSCDLVVARNALAREPWPHWHLQRMHRVLEPGGLLALDEPHALDLSTPGGIAYLAGRAVRQVARWLGVALTPAPRRFRLTLLGAALARLRFATDVLDLERRGGWAALLPRRYAPRLIAITRTLPPLADTPVRAEEHRAHYQAEQPAMLETRRRWIAAHPGWVAANVAEFDPAAYAGRNALVLAPHPDDEVIGAGGAMLKLVRAGAQVACIQATDGSDSAAFAGRPERERRTLRLEEAARVACAIGGVALECWKADNRGFRADPELVARLAARLDRDRPALVFAPFVTEAHADHLTLVRILAHALEALTPPLDATVLSYEVWSLVPPSQAHDITPLLGELEDLLFTYETAMKVDDFVHFCADRALYHGLTVRGEPRWLEAFHAIAARDYPALARTVPA